MKFSRFWLSEIFQERSEKPATYKSTSISPFLSNILHAGCHTDDTTFLCSQRCKDKRKKKKRSGPLTAKDANDHQVERMVLPPACIISYVLYFQAKTQISQQHLKRQRLTC